jgi:hypothetical protein
MARHRLTNVQESWKGSQLALSAVQRISADYARSHHSSVDRQLGKM